jgi:hypothetical protein
MSAVTSITQKTPMQAPEFNQASLGTIKREITQARAVCRVLMTAIDAETDDSISYNDGVGVSRHSPAAGIIVKRISSARDILINTPHAPIIDWTKSHPLASALDSALWFRGRRDECEVKRHEIRIALEVLSEVLDEFLQEAESVIGGEK